MLIGTCGAYPGGPEVGTVVTATHVGHASVSAITGLGYLPRPAEVYAATPLVGVPARVLTLTAITRDARLAAELGADWQIEHMEAWGVAHACARAGARFSAVLAVANRVGPSAHAEWLANRVEAEAAARAAVADLIPG